MKLEGRKTYIVCIAIAALAAVQKFLGVKIPDEVWIVMFSLAVAATRSAVGAAKMAALMLLPALLLCGCAGPNPMQYRISLFEVYCPRISVTLSSPAATNAIACASSRGDAADNTQTVSPSQRGALVMIDNQFAFPVGSGSASSNEVPLSFSFNKE